MHAVKIYINLVARDFFGLETTSGMEEKLKSLSFLESDLLEEISEVGTLVEVETGAELIKEDQYIKQLPIVLNGLVKVYGRFEDRELLLYYIQPKESCIMSFSAILNNAPSKIYAVTEEPSELLLVNAESVHQWLKNYPTFNGLFYNQYQKRYNEMLATVERLVVHKMDHRMLHYLKEKATVTHSNTMHHTHNEIAKELGTVREVVSRVLKKLEVEGHIKQENHTITLLSKIGE